MIDFNLEPEPKTQSRCCLKLFGARITSQQRKEINSRLQSFSEEFPNSHNVELTLFGEDEKITRGSLLIQVCGKCFRVIQNPNVSSDPIAFYENLATNLRIEIKRWKENCPRSQPFSQHDESGPLTESYAI